MENFRRFKIFSPEIAFFYLLFSGLFCHGRKSLKTNKWWGYELSYFVYGNAAIHILILNKKEQGLLR